MELMAQRRGDAVALIREHGGMKAIADHLKTDLKGGISCKPGELEARTTAFGCNFIPPSPPKNFLSLCLDAVQDKTLLILIGAAILSIILGVTVEEQKVLAHCNLVLSHCIVWYWLHTVWYNNVCRLHMCALYSVPHYWVGMGYSLNVDVSISGPLLPGLSFRAPSFRLTGGGHPYCNLSYSLEPLKVPTSRCDFL